MTLNLLQNTEWHSSEQKIKHNDPHRKQALEKCNFASELSLIDFNNCFQHLKDPIVMETKTIKSTVAKKLKKKSAAPNSILRSFYYDFYMPLNKENNLENDTNNFKGNRTSGSDSSNKDEDNNNYKGDKVSSGTITRLTWHSTKKWLTFIITVILIVSSY